jgi:anti-sigma B factor antagonist
MTRPQFRVDRQLLDHNRTVLTVVGELDVASARDFKEILFEVIATRPDAVIVDMARTTFVDSSGLAALLAGVKRLRPREGCLVLATANPSIAHSLQIIGLSDVLPIYPTREAALAGLNERDS